MRGTLLALAMSACLLPASAAADLTATPPPGWTDATPAKKGKMLVAALKGPEKSSFQVARVEGVALDNAGAVRLYLRDVLEGVRQGARLDFKSDGRVERRAFRNGVVFHLIRAELDGKPRLIVGLGEAGAVAFVATLNSAAPEAMLPSLIEAMEYPRVEGAVAESGRARSLDGQLELELGGGLRSRAPTDAQRKAGFVLIIEGAGSELLFQRIDDDATPAAEQAAIVRAAAAEGAGAEPGQAAPTASAPTPAGPVAVYSWARLDSGADARFAVGFLPWGYWGYSLLARGPAADDLLTGVLAAVKAGPSVAPGILGATPPIPLEAPPLDRRLALAAAGVVACALAFLIWSRGRKNANVSA